MKQKYLIAFLFTCACVKTDAQVNIITTIAGKDTAGFCCDGQPAINAKLDYPESLWLDKLGNIYIADPGNNRIRKIEKATGIITTIAGTGVGGYTGDSGLAINAELFLPEAVILDTNGNIYIADAENNVIRKIDASTNIITTVAGNGTVGSTGDNGPATDAELNQASGLCLDKFGNIIIADHHNNKIRKVDRVTGIITAIAGTGTAGYSGDHGPATNAELNGAGEVYEDSSGNIVLSDYYNNVIRRIDISTGIITTIAGNGTAGYSGDNGPATNAEFNMPIGIYIDKQQNIFIADDANGAVRKIDGGTGIITTVAGNGTLGYSGDNGPATAAQVIPTDIFFDNVGDMFIADAGNNCIRKVNNALGVNNVQMNKYADVQMYPNPTAGIFTIENAGRAQMIISDVVGKEVYTAIISSNKEAVNISTLQTGLYMVHIIDPFTEQRVGKKILKE